MTYWRGLEAKMLGTFELTFEGTPVHLPMKQVAKPMQLFQLLLEAGDAGVSRQRVIDALFSHESDADATNSLNVAVSRLRKLLRESLMPDAQYITVRYDRYFFEAPFPIFVDTAEVENLRQAADLAKGHDRIDILYQLCDLYYGRFLPDLDGENWVEILRAYYQRILRVSLSELCLNCRNQGAWSELERLVDFGISLFPHDGWEEWHPCSTPMSMTRNEQLENSVDIEELKRDAASGPVFLADGDGIELVVLSRDAFDRLIDES